MNLTAPKFYIPRRAFQKVMHWVDKAPGEIGGMGLVSYDAENNYFWVRDVFLVKQQVTGGTTDLDDGALGQLEYEIHQKKLEGDLNFWWHSHVNMGVFWSGTDKETIEKYASHGYCVATVFNKKREFRTAVCTVAETPYGAKSQLFFMDNVTTEIYDAPPKDDVIALWDKDYAEKVTEKKFVQKTDKNGQTSFLPPGLPKKQKNQQNHQQEVKFNPNEWRAITDKDFASKLAVWRQHDPSLGLNERERDFLIGAAICKVHPSLFDALWMEFDNHDVRKLDDLVEEFFTSYPDFDWSGNV